MRSSLFWDFTQSRLIVIEVTGQPIGPVSFLDCLALEDGTDNLSQNVYAA